MKKEDSLRRKSHLLAKIKQIVTKLFSSVSWHVRFYTLFFSTGTYLCEHFTSTALHLFHYDALETDHIVQSRFRGNPFFFFFPSRSTVNSREIKKDIEINY